MWEVKHVRIVNKEKHYNFVCLTNFSQVLYPHLPQNFILAFIDELWETWKIRILKKKKKNCWRCHNHMKYNSWDTELDWFFLVISGHFLPFFAPPPKQPRKPKFWKHEKIIWWYHRFKLVLQEAQSYDVCLIRYGKRQT